MAGKLFISYRRSEVAGYARAIYNTLCQEFDPNSIFMDVDAIEPGVDFVEVIENAVSSCDAILVLIGQNWISASGETGRRLEDPNDFVRLEIRTALERNIRVIPVLLDGTKMPDARELPEDIRALARRNALEVSNSRFNTDIGLLIETLNKIAQEVRDKERKQRKEKAVRLTATRAASVNVGNPRTPLFASLLTISVLGALVLGGFFMWKNLNKSEAHNAQAKSMASTTETEESAQDRIQIGLNLIEEEKFDTAIDYFSELAKRYPTEAGAYFHLGRAYGYLGTAYRKRDGEYSPQARTQYEKAIENYTLALGLKEDFAEALLNRAIDRARLNQDDPRVIQDLEKAIQIDSTLENAKTVLHRLRAKEAA